MEVSSRGLIAGSPGGSANHAGSRHADGFQNRGGSSFSRSQKPCGIEVEDQFRRDAGK
jgi:hypothetical protein